MKKVLTVLLVAALSVAAFVITGIVVSVMGYLFMYLAGAIVVIAIGGFAFTCIGAMLGKQPTIKEQWAAKDAKDERDQKQNPF